jgi:dihydroorotate dehydrogenase
MPKTNYEILKLMSFEKKQNSNLNFFKFAAYNMYKSVIKPILFLFPAETAHHIVFSILKVICNIPLVPSIFSFFYKIENKKLEREVFGLKFPNPVGLAAGFDKDAKLYNELFNFGFGFIEIGTVTPKAQDGNEKPRLFRLPTDEALINRMGFNNGGVKEAVERLKMKDRNLIVGGNIGKNKNTPNEEAVSDYIFSFLTLFSYVDYFVVNVSSPNTPGLRSLQEKEPLQNILLQLMDINNKQDSPKPILLKIAPDLTNSQLDDIIDIIKTTKIAGVIATNTTISRENLKTESITIDKIGNGGLSGKPIKNRSTEVIKYLVEKSNNTFPVIGVGGIHSAEDAIEKLKAGASLVQIYTGFIYEGPSLIKEINKRLI